MHFAKPLRNKLRPDIRSLLHYWSDMQIHTKLRTNITTFLQNNLDTKLTLRLHNSLRNMIVSS